MDTQGILAALDAEIEQLKLARTLLLGGSPQSKRGRPAGGARTKATSFNPSEFTAKPKRRTLSAAAREKIAAAQRKRWAKTKAAPKKTAR